MTEEQAVHSKAYSRRERRAGRRRRQPERKNVSNLNQSDFKKKTIPTRILPSLLWSLIASVLSVANPLFTGLANNLQSQQLYAGFAMALGQSPYSHFFGTNGVLYYLLTYVGQLLGTTLGLALFQFIALFIAGIYFDKIVGYFSRSRSTANQLTIWFYLFILAIGFGGTYASLFALPFCLSSIWFLIRYFENAVRDEGFILYGIDAAIVFMIYPKSILLWIVAALVLIVCNINRRQKARGVYLFLTALFGFLLIIYSVGYYTFVQQILGLAIKQTFLYNISLNFTHSGILVTLAIVFGALLVLGFLRNFVATLGVLFKQGHSYIKWTIVLTFIVQLLFIIGNQNFELSQLIILLPYGFVMAVLPLAKEPTAEVVKTPTPEQDSEQAESEVDDKEVLQEEVKPKRFNYLRSSFLLPLLVCVYIPLQPVLFYIQEGNGALNQERTTVATYIQEHATEDAQIYAWDNSAQIYLRSGHLSSASLLTATPYLNTKENQNDLVFALNKNKAEYIVVNNKLDVLDSVQSNLEKNYTKVELDVEHFTVYKKN